MRKTTSAAAGVVVLVLLLAALVTASCGGSDTTTTVAPATTASSGAAATVDGAAIYKDNCSGCHEKTPGGNAEEVKSVIEAGKESMPSYKDKLTAEQIAALVTYVTSGGN